MHRLITLTLLASVSALAQPYPVKPIRMIVPFSAGGPNDVAARIVAQQLSAQWGQSVVIDNRTGAGGNIGTVMAARANPDGYTLLLMGMHFVVNPSLYRAAGYHIENDFSPVTNVAISPVGIAAHAALPARDIRELVALAKKGLIDYGSPGTGTAGHLAAELLTLMAGVKMQHIPYKGAAPAISDLLGGQIKLTFTAFPILTPHVKAGKLRALGVSTLQRTSALPDVPTVAESGYAGYAVDNMYGVAAPRGTPAAIVAQLHMAIAQTLKQPELRERMIAQGFEPLANTPAQFADYLRAETVKWAKVVREAGLRAE
jgi:tripartite-type tricarboxylate transporter receptor subunit TctC